MNDADLQAVYRETVLEHSRSPHHFGRMDNPDQVATGHNPLCGDKLTVYVKMAQDSVADISFEGTGCAISMASASMMTDSVKGRSVAEAGRLVNSVQQMLNSETTDDEQGLKEMRALEGVRSYPSRIKCATLAWTALDAALQGTVADVSTE